MDSSLLEGVVLTDGQPNGTDQGINSSGSGGGPSIEGGPNPGGGPNQGPNNLGISHANALPRDDSNNSLISDTSYSSDDIKQAAGAELQNMENILNDKSLTEEEKNKKAMEMYTKVQNDLINAKTEIKNLKKSGNITIGINK